MGNPGKISNYAEGKIHSINVLIVEDSQNDADLIVHELKRAGFDPKWKRVETADDMDSSLDAETWDVIISDYKMPSFSGLDALHLLQRKNVDIPFIISSGTIGEEIAVSIMKSGANNYIMKDNLARLPSAVERELRDAEIRKARKKAEEELKRKTEEIYDLYNNSPCGYHSIDKNGVFIQMNDTELKWIGYSREEIIGKKKLTDIITTESIGTFNRTFPMLKKNGNIQDLELELVRKNGSILPVLLNAGVVKDENGEFLCTRSSLFDITEIKLAEAVLKNSESRYRSLFENMQEGFAYCRMLYKDSMPQDFIYLNVNRAFEALTGLKNVAGKKVSEVIPGIRESSPELFDIYGRVALTGKPEKFELYLDPLKIWVSISVYSYLKEHFVSLFDNITERKKTEESLKASNEFNETLIRTIPFGFQIVDEEGKILFLNDKMEKLIGYDAVGEYCWLIYKDDKKQSANCPLKQDIHVGETKTIESYGVFGGKTYEITHTVMIYKGKIAILEIFNDISDRKQMEERIKQSEKMEAVGQLAGGIAHDFNNQLAGIMGYAEMLATRLDDDNLRDYAEKIVRASRRSADLTRNLLSFSRKGKYLDIPVNMHNIIEEVVTILEHSINKKIEIKRMLKSSPATIIGDPTQIQNALLNLAINARDAMPDGGELAFTTENISMEETPLKFDMPNVSTERCLKLCVSDSGIGMDKKVIKHLFEPFFTTKDVGKGTGMGLASVYGTVKNHHGFISVLSEPGKGSTFIMYFPLYEDVIQLENKETKLIKHKISANVLVVDDEEMVRHLLIEMLKMLGHKTIACKDGAEAVEIYKKSYRDIDIVILDMEMPKMSGKDTFFAIRAINPDVKVLLASGFSVEGEAQTLIEAGVKGFVQKPFNIAELSRSLNEALKEE